jgi:hypothetical protein
MIDIFFVASQQRISLQMRTHNLEEVPADFVVFGFGVEFSIIASTAGTDPNDDQSRPKEQ